MNITLKAIGTAHTDAEEIPRHWTISEVEGRIVINEIYKDGLKDIQAGQSIVVLFHFHESPEFSSEYLIQTPKHLKKDMGIFSICSPVRPNPIGMSVLKVLAVDGNVLRVKGIDMTDGTPILDIKPHVKDDKSCPT